MFLECMKCLRVGQNQNETQLQARRFEASRAESGGDVARRTSRDTLARRNSQAAHKLGEDVDDEVLGQVAGAARSARAGRHARQCYVIAGVGGRDVRAALRTRPCGVRAAAAHELVQVAAVCVVHHDVQCALAREAVVIAAQMLHIHIEP